MISSLHRMLIGFDDTVFLILIKNNHILRIRLGKLCSHASPLAQLALRWYSASHTWIVLLWLGSDAERPSHLGFLLGPETALDPVLTFMTIGLTETDQNDECRFQECGASGFDSSVTSCVRTVAPDFGHNLRSIYLFALISGVSIPMSATIVQSKFGWSSEVFAFGVKSLCSAASR